MLAVVPITRFSEADRTPTLFQESPEEHRSRLPSPFSPNSAVLSIHLPNKIGENHLKNTQDSHLIQAKTGENMLVSVPHLNAPF